MVLHRWCGGIVFGVKQIRKNPKGRYYFDYCLLKLPILGALLRKIAVARFTRTLGTLSPRACQSWKVWAATISSISATEISRGMVWKRWSGRTEGA